MQNRLWLGVGHFAVIDRRCFHFVDSEFRRGFIHTRDGRVHHVDNGDRDGQGQQHEQRGEEGGRGEERAH